MTRMRGMLRSAAKFQTVVVTDSMPDCALMRRTAASAGSMAARASWTNMWKPGVSMRLMRMPSHSAKATALDMVMPRASSSSS